MPTGVQAFFLLKAANLTPESEKLARATSKLEYPDMRDKLMKIFGDPGVLDSDDMVPEVKQEVFYGSNRDRKRGRGRGGYRGGLSRGGRFQENEQDEAKSTQSEEKKNPISGGKVLRCYECDSTKHLANKCPHRKESVYEQQVNVHITLLSSEPQNHRKGLLYESFGKAVLDSACSKTVTGELWFDEYVKILSDDDNSKIVEKGSSSMFRFGDGKESQSLKLVTIPVLIGKEKILLDVDVVEKDIPLLLSKGAMKQLKMKIDFKNDRVNVNGSVVKLFCTNTGHYCLPLSNFCLDAKSANVVLYTDGLFGITKKEKMLKAIKLHRQFSHASKERLLKLIKDSGCKDKEFVSCVKQCCDDCKICQRFRKAPLRPCVGLPVADRFNQVVSMDLKEYEKGKWFLHMIDTATRYSAGCLTNTKDKNVIVSKVMQTWVRYFGSPKKFLFDNGGEFSNETMKELGEKLGVEIAVTAAEAPFSNGTVERHNAIIWEGMKKTIAETKCDPEIALGWSISAKNSLQNQGGYSPNQLVFGYNPNFPSVLTDLPPALNATTSSDIIRKNLEAMHSARKNHIEAESSQKIRRALRQKTRTYADESFSNDEKVFYKRRSWKGWRGPGTVIGQEGKIVLIRHGSFYYRCHPCHIMKMHSTGKAQKSTSEMKKPITKKDPALVIRAGVHASGESEDETTEDETTDEVNTEDEDEDHSANGEENNQEQEVDEKEVEEENTVSENSDDEEEDHADEEDDIGDNVEDGEEGGEENDEGTTEEGGMMLNQTRPKPKMFIEFYMNDGTSDRTTVLSQQPKRNSKWKDWLNVHIEGSSQSSSLNWDYVVTWKCLPEPEVAVFLTEIEEMSQEVIDAKEREINNLIENDVFEAVSDEGQKRVSCR